MQRSLNKGCVGRVLICALLVLFAAHTNLVAREGASGEAGTDVSSRVHIFYYGWYGAPPMQQSFIHWPQGGHVPPEDIGSNYYPMLGAYSSTDPSVLKQHMQWIRRAHVGVLTLTWWGRDSYTDKNVQAVLDAAAEAGLRVNFHIEPYSGRTPRSVADDIAYILSKYGRHPAFYRADFLDNSPLFYIYEVLRNPAQEWKAATDQIHSGSSEPVILIAQTSNLRFVRGGGFDGGYTYDGLAPFRNAGFSAHWKEVEQSFAEAGKLFIPSVGPGYWDDRAVRSGGADEPEAARTRDKSSAATYDRAWNDAVEARAPIITVTSFNEWHEGSQIEPAVEHRGASYTYPSYGNDAFQYLTRTAKHVQKYEGVLKSVSRSK